MTDAPLQRRRGEPVVVLLAIGVLWIGGRALTWETPIYPEGMPGGEAAVRFDRPVPSDLWAPVSLTNPGTSSPDPETRMASKLAPREATAAVVSHLALRPIGTYAGPPTASEASIFVFPTPQDGRPPATAIAVPTTVEFPPGFAPHRQRGWHVDAWYAWRPGSGLPRVAAGAAPALAYGGTQGGILLRADLGTSEYRPQAYLRAIHAPARPAQGDVALGIGGRPIPGVPVRLQGEARVTRIAGETSVRPAVAAIAELAPVALPLGFSAETYGQAGWVGGRYATPFVDGQLRVERALASAGSARVQVGAGAWGGAQKFAGRLDVGPTASVALDLGGTASRIAVDYRIRVLGNARPENGVAVTLSTGF